MCIRTMETGRFLAALFLFVLLFVSCCAVADGANQGNNSSVNDGVETEEDKSSLEKGLEPLYDMTSNFLDVLQPESKGYILEILGIDDLSTDDDLEKLEDAIDEDRDEVLKHYIGYVICVAVGALYIILIPIIGFCFCVCRCCGNCGAHQGAVKRRDKCRRICCGLSLGIFNTIILAGVVCAFMTNELIRQQTAKDDESYVQTLAKGLDDLSAFKTSSIAVYKSVNNGMMQRIEIAKSKALDIPNTARDQLGALTNSAAILDRADTLADSVDAINVSLTYIDQYTTSLTNQRTDLTNQLSTLKTDIQAKLDNCGTGSCSDVKDKVASLATEADYSKLLIEMDTVETQLTGIQDLIEGDLRGSIQQGRNEYDGISTDIDDDIDTELDNVTREADEMSAVVVQAVDDGIASFDEVDTGELKENLLKKENDVEDYGNYRFYAGIGLSCIMLLVVLFYYLGLVFGIIGDVPGEDARPCNRSIGANLLMAGVAFTFIFGWLLMIGTIILFIVGGPMNTELCRYLVDPTESDATDYIDRVVANAFNESSDYNLNLKPAYALRSCKNNGAVYTAFNLVTVVNATEKLDLSNYGLQKELNKLSEVDVDLSDIDILSDDTRAKLEKLRDIGLDDIDFQSFYDELDLAVLTPNLTGLAGDLDAAADGLQDGQTKDDLKDSAQDLRDLEAGLVADMVSGEKQLKKHLDDLQKELYGDVKTSNFSEKVGNLIREFETAETVLRLNGTQLIKTIVHRTATYIYLELNGFAVHLEIAIRETLAPCGDAYVALNDMIDATCKSVLKPANGFWFSFGWCLIFGIPCLIFAIYLADLYRRTEDFTGKGLDEPNYDAYTRGYHGDNIPLEDDRKKLKLTGIQHRKKQQRSAQGHQNPAYIREDTRGGYRGNPRNAGYVQNGANGGGGGGGGGHGASAYNPGGSSGHYENGHYENGHYPGPPSTSPPNPPHYYNNHRFY